jgi:hypothetical protein
VGLVPHEATSLSFSFGPLSRSCPSGLNRRCACLTRLDIPVNVESMYRGLNQAFRRRTTQSNH